MHSAPDSNEPLSKGIALSYSTLHHSGCSFFDLSELQVAVDKIADKLLLKLLQDNAAVEITLPLTIKEGELPQKIGQLRGIQLKLEELNQSEQSLYLGYPIVNLNNEHGLLSHCPVFIWPVQLSALPEKSRHWKIESPALQALKLHPLLEKQLLKVRPEQTISVDLNQGIDAVTQDDIYQQIASSLGLSIQSSESISSYNFDDYQSINRISKAFLLGNFVQEDLDTIEIKETVQKIKPNLPTKWTYPLAALRLNAWQKHSIQAIFKGKDLWIQGPSRSGKSQVITAAIPALLSAGKTVLYLVDNAEQEQFFSKALHTMGMDQIPCLNLFSETQISTTALDFLVDLKKKIKKKVPFESIDFQQAWAQLKGLEQRLSPALSSANTKVLGDLSWPDLIGQYLRANYKSNQAILQAVLPPDSFEFTQEEYAFMGQALQEHYPLFKAIKSLNHPFQLVHDRFFDEEQSYESIREQLKIHVHLYKQKFTTLYHRLIAQKETQTKNFYFEQLGFAHRSIDQIKQIVHRLNTYQRLYGDDFNKQGSFQDAKLKLLALFSKKFKAIRSAKIELNDACKILQAQLKKQRFVHLNIPILTDTQHFEALANKLETLKVLLASWVTNSMPTKETAEMLYYADQKSSQKYTEELQLIHAKCRKAFEQFNEDAWQITAIEWEEYTEEDYPQIFEKSLKSIQLMQDNWAVFEAFYTWKQSWNQLTVNAQLMIDVFIKMQLDDWDAAFKSWYLHHVLHRSYIDVLSDMKLDFSDIFEAYVQGLERVQQQLVYKATKRYYEQLNEPLKELKKEKALALSKVKLVFVGKPFQDLLEWLGQKYISTIFPVVIAHPDTISSLIDLGLNFDLNVFDLRETHYLEVCKPIISRKGQQFICLNNLKSEDSDKLNLLFEREKSVFTEQHILPSLVEVTPNDFGLRAGKPLILHDGINVYLKDFINEERIHFSAQIQGIYLDIVILPADENSTKKPFVILCDRGIHLDEQQDFQLVVDRLSMLQNADYPHYLLETVRWWKDSQQALQQLLVPLLKWETS